MNPEAKKILEDILQKNPEDLTPTEVTFLNARRTYLNNEQIRIFTPVLVDTTLKETPPLYVSKHQKTKYVKPVEEVLAETPETTQGTGQNLDSGAKFSTETNKFEDNSKDPDAR